MKKITTLITAFLLGLGLAVLPTAPTYAADDTCNENIPLEVRQAAGCPGTAAPVTLQSVITNILYSVILVLGIVAVIFIIKGGIDYITSAGDATKLQKAKNTIVYAVIGLVVSVLAFAIVNFTIGVLNRSTQGNSQQNSSQQDNSQQNSSQQNNTQKTN